MSRELAVVIALSALWLSLGAAVVAVLGVRSRRVAPERLQATPQATPGRLSTRLEATHKPDRPGSLVTMLDVAGSEQRPGDFLITAGGTTLAGAAVGLFIGGPVVALILAIMLPLFFRLGLGLRASRRRKAFADQLDDSLQLLSGSLRAGHSLLQALDAVSSEAEKPTSVEFARLVNETRVGRELSDALDEVAARTRSDDFAWVAQAIAIHREVGGDLSEVLATVSHTIRERNQIRRQVGALSAEGKLSAFVLMALPVGIVTFLATTNPGYLAPFTASALGYGMIVAAAVLLTVGALWLRAVVSFKF
jgi:tight adherence protein B